MEFSNTLLEQALCLKPQERFSLVDSLLLSLDEPDKEIDEIWAIESEKRLIAYRSGKLKGIPFEDVFGEKI
ncbi:addiction module protein [Candidatus Desantisbacteria bacterium CG2_30_40_21]|uniref:Addiction module protein n=5 Tax=unclassified Candidatus Desantisiibacteriota TaxID=3106372 RepID=A0A2M7JCT3_9BACT|nr:MAG: addiction module protein [Candidatus Desantisbacteria bacterium CG2_30_40_21]PIP40809.1 MAG: addiction module protein [Candidatus Desantisbacteria bacterium CG23_combo_of_CG06-09_8_20_14_all_40_23]PIX17240.1 MAG: addiction module protein [Candidatus Desantisbacteria bacterium CG_4_8_14_3_um_filter_40_12]PIY20029.1 MAG: addiction module protein [Candidatus Desantisbacteria bacterium CG_4_10_14_3_um_filter_40_18]PJB30262.1 MAG: addiction module protein [Candidatus Desantisbacteria bacteri